MKFHIESTNWGNKEEDLIEHYPWLKDFEYKDGQIIVNNLTALMDLTINVNVGIIIFPEHEVYDPKSKKWIVTGVPNIEIYDGYRE